MKDTDFVEASGYLRILEKRILTGDSIDRIIDAPDVTEVLKLLSQNSEYDFSILKRPEDYETVLKAELKKLYDLAYVLTRSDLVVNIPASKYDFHNIKVILKAKCLDKDRSDLLIHVSKINTDSIKEAVFNRESVKEDFPQHMVNAIDTAMKVYEKKQDAQSIDIVLDKLMFEYMLGLARLTENEFITDYVRLNIDFHNIKTLMRVKNMQMDFKFLQESLIPDGITDTMLFLENYDQQPDQVATNFYYQYFGNTMRTAMDGYEKAGNFGTLEKLFDNRLIEHIKKSKYIAFGPELLYAYIISKENEIRQIRILITCKINGISVETLKERLRENYA